MNSVRFLAVLAAGALALGPCRVRADDAAGATPPAACDAGARDAVRARFDAAVSEWHDAFAAAQRSVAAGTATAAVLDAADRAAEKLGIAASAPALSGCLAAAAAGEDDRGALLSQVDDFEAVTTARRNAAGSATAGSGAFDDAGAAMERRIVALRADLGGTAVPPVRDAAPDRDAATPPSTSAAPHGIPLAELAAPSAPAATPASLERRILEGDCAGVRAALAPFVARRDPLALEDAGIAATRDCDREESAADTTSFFRRAVAAGVRDRYPEGYLAKYGTPPDYARALRLLKAAVADGSLPARESLADLYDRGLGVPRDGRLAVAYKKQAARIDDDLALVYLADDAYTGSNGVTKSEAAGNAYLARALAHGAPNALAYEADQYATGHAVRKDPARAVELWTEAADGHDASAEASLANVCAYGADGVTEDDARAIGYARRAALAGDAAGMTMLGFLEASGRGTAMDRASALSWFRRAAALHDADAEFDLGVAYRDGLGVPADPGLTAYWFRVAARDGSDAASAELARLGAPARGPGSTQGSTYDAAAAEHERQREEQARNQQQPQPGSPASPNQPSYEPPPYTPPAYDPPAYNPPPYEPPPYNPPPYDPH